ncbi:ROK family protein [Flavivirga spongiicola]|uniref:ROK family protein n=1 Tax=Flavivirga spongiicola TaxID=421621 RepID=A0ABU7XLB0_9FLAO|nr:ROK family protein [Flavivirga sp. MEBiC05379]MDO5981218.1 ROK family protein [Flavivirga sp. MEBiC05379]
MKPIIGVLLEGKTIKVGKILDGNIIKSCTKIIDNRASKEHVISEVITAIDEVFDKEIEGIGIGVPGLVDLNQGVIYQIQKIPSWKEVHIKDILESRFQVKVYVNNDANCFAVGEKYFGVAKNYENIVGLILGSGVGTGVIFKNHLYSGTNCGAGELGYLQYKEHDFEYYCSTSYFKEKYDLDFKTLYKRAKQDDKIALAIFEQYGQDLGNLIKAILLVADPEIIVIGGAISNAFSFFKKEMFRVVKTFMYKHVLNNLKIVVSENKNIDVLGASALFYDAQNNTLKKY